MKPAFRANVSESMLERLLPSGWVKEHRFHPVRKWRFDYAWPQYKIALEIEGAVWSRGRHTRGSGFVKDIEKYDEAVLLGWRLVRITRGDFDKGRAADLVQSIINSLHQPTDAL